MNLKKYAIHRWRRLSLSSLLRCFSLVSWINMILTPDFGEIRVFLRAEPLISQKSEAEII